MAKIFPAKDITFKPISFTALELFISCSQAYNQKYINKVQHERTIAYPLVMGDWTHLLLEEKLLDPELDLFLYLRSCVPGWFASYGVELQDVSLEELMSCVRELSNLLYRASAHCTDPEKALRNKDNSVMKDPITYPGRAFLKELKNLKNYRVKSQADLEISRQNEAFIAFSLVWALAESLLYAETFTPPSWISSTIETEWAFGVTEDTKVPLANGDASVYGYVDWVAEVETGQIAIIDHKTSKSKPTPLDVLYHPQLNLYAHAYEQVYGRRVDVIGINHVRSGEVIYAEVNEFVMESTYEHFNELYTNAKSGPYIKRRPTDYNTPCVKKDYKSGRVTETCPFIGSCWPHYYKLLDNEYS